MARQKGEGEGEGEGEGKEEIKSESNKPGASDTSDTSASGKLATATPRGLRQVAREEVGGLAYMGPDDPEVVSVGPIKPHLQRSEKPNKYLGLEAFGNWECLCGGRGHLPTLSHPVTAQSPYPEKEN